MCGAESFLVKAEIEGTELKVCKNCARFGKVVNRFPDKKKNFGKSFVKSRPEEPKSVEMIVEDYSKILKSAREQKGLKQEELAKLVKEKESIIHHMESGEFKPSIFLAKKLEKFLHVKLIEQYEETHAVVGGKSGSGATTIGDLIKIKKR